MTAEEWHKVKEVHDDIGLVSFMDYDLGYFDLESQIVKFGEPPGSIIESQTP